MKRKGASFTKYSALGTKITATSRETGMRDMLSVDVITGFFHTDYYLKSAWLRKGIKPADIAHWKAGRIIGESTVFISSTGAKFIVKPCIGRNPRTVLQTLARLAKAGIRIETPIGLLKDTKGRLLLITRFVGEKTIKDYFRHSSVSEKQSVTRQAAKILAQLHKAGFLHGHSHTENFVVNKGVVRMIDATLVRK